MARKEEKPSLGKRLTEWAMTAGVLVLLGGLVCAFLVAGIFYVLVAFIWLIPDRRIEKAVGTGKA